jgi:hypothetical protein
MKEVLGLEDDAIDKAISTIRATGSGQNLSDANIRRNIGPQALTMINKGMDAIGSGEEASMDDGPSHEEPEPEMTDDVREGIGTLKDFLIRETTVTMDVDTSDPNAAVQAVRQKSRVANASPDRASQMEIKAARDKKKAAASDDTPNAGIKKQIAGTQEKLAMLNKRLRDSEKRAGA